MATRFLKISSNGNKIFKSKLIKAPSYIIIFNFSFPFSIDSRSFRPACLYNTNSVDLKDEYGPEATNPVEEARERLIDLELNIERRYLKAPLGSNANINLQTITARITKTSARARENEEKQNMVIFF